MTTSDQVPMETENKNSSSTNMSVSEPNLTASEASAVSLLETFAAVARRRTSATSATSVTSTNTKNQSNSSNSSASGLFGTKSVSSLVRLAISSNFPASLLNSAQSYPSLGAASATSTASPGSGVGVVGSGGQNHDTEQVSLEEFLESCRATSLLAELEDDDEELPDADEDENDEDDANDDEEEYDENYDEESGSGLGLQPRNSSSRRKTWDEEHVIKRKFSALIPAFDPRPGRTNINQTSDLDIALPAVPSAAASEGEAGPSENVPEVTRNSPERGDVPRW